jgi:hypothetical protein
MRVEVVESLPAAGTTDTVLLDDSATERALRTFFATIESDDSLFTCRPVVARPSENASRGSAACGGDFVLQVRGAGLGGNRRLHFSLVEKMVELLNDAGSAEWLAAQLSLLPDPKGAAGWALTLRLVAQGNSAEQAALRWGLGVAHVQQALLFTSRYLRQQMGQNGD